MHVNCTDADEVHHFLNIQSGGTRIFILDEAQAMPAKLKTRLLTAIKPNQRTNVRDNMRVIYILCVAAERVTEIEEAKTRKAGGTPLADRLCSLEMKPLSPIERVEFIERVFKDERAGRLCLLDQDAFIEAAKKHKLDIPRKILKALDMVLDGTVIEEAVQAHVPKRQATKKLTPEQRVARVVEMLRAGDVSVTDVEHELGVSRGTAQSTLVEAKRRHL